MSFFHPIDVSAVNSPDGNLFHIKLFTQKTVLLQHCLFDLITKRFLSVAHGYHKFRNEKPLPITAEINENQNIIKFIMYFMGIVIVDVVLADDSFI
jgi:hypothetical protein